MALIKLWTEPVEVSASDPITATLFNEQVYQNLLYLKDRNYDEVVATGLADWSTASTTPAKVDSSRYLVQISTTTGAVEIYVNLHVINHSGRFAFGGILIDDDYMFGDPAGPGGTTAEMLWQTYTYTDSTPDPVMWSGTYKLYDLDPGIHTFEPQLWVSGGSGTGLYQGNGIVNIFGVREI